MDSTGRITREIIEHIRTEGPKGVDEFVRHYGPRLLVFVRYKLGRRLESKVDPEDVLQDFFASLVEDSERFLARSKRSMNTEAWSAFSAIWTNRHRNCSSSSSSKS